MRGLVWFAVIIFSLMIVAVIAGLSILSVFHLFYATQAYYENHIKKAIVKFVYAFLLIAPLFFVVSWFTLTSKYDLTLKISILTLLMSSFLGLAIFIFFLFSLKRKKLKETLFSLMIGGLIFLFFAPSAYFVVSPIVRYKIEIDNQKERHQNFLQLLKKDNKKVFEFLELETNRTFPEESRVLKINNREEQGHMTILIETTARFVKSLPLFIIIHREDNKNKYLKYYIHINKIKGNPNLLSVMCSY